MTSLQLIMVCTTAGTTFFHIKKARTMDREDKESWIMWLDQWADDLASEMRQYDEKEEIYEIAENMLYACCLSIAKIEKIKTKR